MRRATCCTLILVALVGLGGHRGLARFVDAAWQGYHSGPKVGRGDPELLKVLIRTALDGAKVGSREGRQPTTTTPSTLQRRAEEEQANDDNDDENVARNNLCSDFLLSFLEGTTDADDTCDGIKNAYLAADCAADDEEYNSENDNDDYFGQFTEHTCCHTLLTHYGGYCTEADLLTNVHLLFAALVLILSECAKSLMKRWNINFIPEAGICILVGTGCALITSVIPGIDLNGVSFDDGLFMKVLLPPIVFEAALAVSKVQFKKSRTAILVFAVIGTAISTLLTGVIVHYVSSISKSTTFPMLESLVFGALISSIDPVAILSVLTNLGLTQMDVVFILIFGESLLNDGIAITIFKTLVSRFDGLNDGTTSVGEVFSAISDFLIAMFGAIAIALACGCTAWLYFYTLKKTLGPAMEVGSFFLWAIIPFYISEAVGCSGIVSLVGMGFFMDIYIANPKSKEPSSVIDATCVQDPCETNYYSEMGSCQSTARDGVSVVSIAPLSGTARIRLSPVAEKHIRFVAHLAAQIAENAIFAYLGLFLFSQHYDWDPALISIAIAACIISRAVMVAFLSQIILMIYRCRGRAPNSKSDPILDSLQDGRRSKNVSKTAAAIQDPRTQAVLVLSGLRGAVSLALVDNVPIYNGLTGEGCELKPLMKGMTSASIIFTTFVFGGLAYYALPLLGFSTSDAPSNSQKDGPPPHAIELPNAVLQGMDDIGTKPSSASELSNKF